MLVILLVALQLMAHGALMTASFHMESARAVSGFAQARRAARVAVLEALRGPPPEGAGALPVGGRLDLTAGTRHGLSLQTQWTRLSPEQWLVEGRAGRSLRSPTVTAARVAWSMDPVTRIGEFRAVVEVAALSPVSGSPSWEGLPEADPRCEEWNSRLIEVTPPEGLSEVGHRDDLARGGPGFGPVRWIDLGGRAASLPGAAGTPGPEVRLGRCVVESPWNFGDPLGDTTPCADHFGLGAVEGSLRLVGGMAQGLLAVPGDLTLSERALFEGVLLVGGRLRLEGSSTFRGLAVAVGGVHLGDGSRILGSSCSAVRALSAVRPRLGIPLAVPGSGWIMLP